MQSKSIKFGFLSSIILILVLLTACVNPQPAQTEKPLPTSLSNPATAPTQALSLGIKPCGNLTVKLTSNSNPPIRGNNIFQAFLTDEQGQPVSDAKLAFDIDMTNMSHGKNVVIASPVGNGIYSGNLSFMMPGPWRLILSVERGGQTNTVRFDFNVSFK